MSNSREAVAAYVEKNFGPEAAAGFLDWSGKNDWDDKVKQYLEDYKAFKASGKTAKDLSKEDISAYIKKVAGTDAAKYFEKNITKESLKQLPEMGKKAFAKHGGFIKKYMGKAKEA